MKNLTEREIDEKFGRWNRHQSPTHSATTSSIGYLKGIPFIDEMIELNHKGSIPKTFVNFYMRPYGLVLKITMGYPFYSGFEHRFLNWYIFESQQTVFEKKSKSVVGRAIIGGLLLGAVGALVGGMSGIGTKEIKDKSIPENILTIGITDDNQEKMLFFSVENSVLSELRTFLTANYPNKLTTRMPEPVRQTPEPQANNGISIADEIVKLKKLLNDGVITLSEYDAAKKKLLG